MKRFLFITAALLMALLFVSCKKTDNENLPGKDPEGTVLAYLITWVSDGDVHIKTEDHDVCLQISRSGTITGGLECYGKVEFASIGTVQGLWEIKSIPKSGWVESVAAADNNGYIIKATIGDTSQSFYIRFCVVNVQADVVVGQTSAGKTMYGSKALIKYQAPFKP